jgi:hypothetical protein
MVNETEFLELKQYAIEHEVFSGVVANRAEHKEFKARLLSLFSFIEPRKGKSPIGVMINCLLNDIKDKPTCKQCGDLHSKYGNVAFTDYCSKSCATIGYKARDPKRAQKNRRTYYFKHRDKILKKKKEYYCCSDKKSKCNHQTT